MIIKEMIEENIKRVKDYLETEDIIEEFCERVIMEYKKYDNLCNNVYKNLDSFKLYDDCIEITTEQTFRNESNYNYIDVPIDVFYENSVEEYVKNLSEQRAKEEEEEKKKKEDEDRQKAIEEVKRLKEKYNI